MGLRAGQVLSHLFAVLVGDDGALGRTRVGTEHDPVFEEAPDDGRSGARRLGQGEALVCQEVVSVGWINGVQRSY